MNRDQPKMHFESKGWGFEKWIVNKKEYCGKLLYFVKNRRCSMHYHIRKDETFYLQSGKVLILYHDNPESIKPFMATRWEEMCERVTLEPGDNLYIPQGRVHQIIALQDSELFEFSTFHQNSDSCRLMKGD